MFEQLGLALAVHVEDRRDEEPSLELLEPLLMREVWTLRNADLPQP